MHYRNILFLSLFLISACATTGSNQPDDPPEPRLFAPYDNSASCKGCHFEIHTQFQQSEHSRAFSDPLFNAQYFKRVVPKALADRSFIPEARKCIYCHAPVLYMNYTGLIRSPSQIGRFETGVTCDFCHTLSGFAPNGDFVMNRSLKKQGPKKTITWHSEYSGFLEMSEFCSTCHNDSNHSGSSMASTFGEWQKSSFVSRKISCQECHMNKNGYLTDGKAEHDRGVATVMNMGFNTARKYDSPVYEKLYTHSFPGAHTNSQLIGSLPMDITVQARTPQGITVAIRIDNSRTGHMMPSGSSDLRLLWLSVTAETAEGKVLTVKQRTRPGATPDYSQAGITPDDAAILGTDVPRGERVYRSVSVDAEGKQTLLHLGPATTVFDNRLKTEEVRKEDYFVQVPSTYDGQIRVSATLQYLNAPTSVTRALEIPDSQPVVISTKTASFTTKSPQPGTAR